MKLKNKKTREIIEVITGDTFEVGGIQIRSLKRNPQIVRYYLSLAELNTEWEDVPEEPKEYWFISTTGEVHRFEGEDKIYTPGRKQLGNYFETKEEAKKAVEKLKAWKRLKDKGFRFIDNKIIGEYGNVTYTLNYPATAIEEKDLDLLFGGEE